MIKKRKKNNRPREKKESRSLVVELRNILARIRPLNILLFIKLKRQVKKMKHSQVNKQLQSNDISMSQGTR